ncbi:MULTISPECIES: hypothetical protein [unclassified Pantoea]|uniref:hypothetical protein n=1 Tax=unclassified Pantoea TaxID=2630326 RepID=UPI0028B08B9B|nr:hypothetical protein [Pantoea sp.]
MKDRETAEKITETLFDVADKLHASVDMIDAYAQEGKVSKEEADTYRTTVMSSLEEMYESIVGPIFELHPDLRPACCGCDSSEADEGEQP